MFIIKQNKIITAEVKFFEPTNHDEEPKEIVIVVSYKVQPKKVKKERTKNAEKALKDFRSLLEGSRGNVAIEEEERDEDLLDRDDQLGYLREDIVNIKGVGMEDGSEAPFSSDLFDAIMEASYARSAIEDSWRLVQQDQAWIKAKVKN